MYILPDVLNYVALDAADERTKHPTLFISEPHSDQTVEAGAVARIRDLHETTRDGDSTLLRNLHKDHPYGHSS